MPEDITGQIKELIKSSVFYFRLYTSKSERSDVYRC